MKFLLPIGLLLALQIDATAKLREGFEDKRALADWQHAGQGSAGWDGLVKFRGSGSLRLEGGDRNQPQSLSRQMAASRSAASWMASARFRIVDADSVYLLVEALGTDGATIATAKSEPMSGNTFEETWQPVSIAIDLPENVASTRLAIVSEGSGTTWVDDVRFHPQESENAKEVKPGEKGFTKVPYRESRPQFAFTEAEEKNGFLLFQRNPLAHLFPESRPAESERAERVSIAACAGQTEPFLLGIYAKRAMGITSLVVSEARDQHGNTIAASAFSLGVIKTIPKRFLYHSKWSKNYSDLPILIEKAAPPYSLQADTSLGFWMDCRLPDDVAPGVYQATITVVAESGQVTLPLEIEVYPFKLVSPDEMFFGAFATGWNLEALSEKGVREWLAEMRGSGMTTLGYLAPWVEYREKGAELEMDLLPVYRVLSKGYLDLGFPQPLIQLTDPSRAFLARKPGLSPEERILTYRQLSKQLYQVARAEGLPDFFLQPFDEPSFFSKETQELAFSMTKTLKEAGLKTTQTGIPDRYLLDRIGQHADIWMLNGVIPSEEQVHEAKQAGKKIVIYNTDVETWQPVVTRYTAGFFQWKHGLDGAMQWQFQTPPSGDTYHEVRDGLEIAYMAYFYPPIGDRPGGPTVAWKAFRAGIDDYRYLLSLQHQIEQRRETHPELAKEAEEALKVMKASLNDLRRLRNVAYWSESGPDDGFLSGELKLPNGWDTQDYDRNRRVIAGWISRLQKGE